jgi:hypothetical protein
VLTIRPGFESDFVTYVETGAIGSSDPYLSIAEEMQASANTNWQLIGPAQPSANPSGLGSAFRIEAFDIDIAKRRARCPSGFLSTQCSRIEESKRQKVSFRLEWSYHCRSCLLRSQCVPAGQPHRTIVVGQYHELLQQRRRDHNKVRSSRSGCSNVMRSKARSANWRALTVASLKWNCKISLSAPPAISNDGCGSWPKPTSILKSTFYSSETSSKGSKVFVGHSGLV